MATSHIPSQVPGYVKVPMAAVLLGVRTDSIYQSIREGQLPSQRFDRVHFVPIGPLVDLAMRSGVPSAAIRQAFGPEVEEQLAQRPVAKHRPVVWGSSRAGKCQRCMSNSMLVRGECMSCGWGSDQS